MECAEALNDLLHCAWNRVSLVSADPYGLLLLYLSVSESFGFVECLQDQGESDQPVVFILHKFTHSEEKAGWLA